MCEGAVPNSAEWDQRCWNILCHALCWLAPLCLSLLQNLGAPTGPPSVVGKEVINRQIIVFLFLSSQIGSASPPGGADKQISWLWKKSRGGSLVPAEAGLFSWQAGKDPAWQFLLQFLL